MKVAQEFEGRATTKLAKMRKEKIETMEKLCTLGCPFITLVFDGLSLL